MGHTGCPSEGLVPCQGWGTVGPTGEAVDYMDPAESQGSQWKTAQPWGPGQLVIEAPSPRHTRPLASQVFTEDLTNLKYIGEGGFGTVFWAEHKKWCIPVAVKIVNS